MSRLTDNFLFKIKPATGHLPSKTVLITAVLFSLTYSFYYTTYFTTHISFLKDCKRKNYAVRSQKSGFRQGDGGLKKCMKGL